MINKSKHGQNKWWQTKMGQTNIKQEMAFKNNKKKIKKKRKRYLSRRLFRHARFHLPWRWLGLLWWKAIKKIFKKWEKKWECTSFLKAVVVWNWKRGALRREWKSFEVTARMGMGEARDDFLKILSFIWILNFSEELNFEIKFNHHRFKDSSDFC